MKLFIRITAKCTLLAIAVLWPCFAFAQTSVDLISVPEGFTVERVTTPGLTSYPMFMTFDDEGRLFIAESTGKDLSGEEMVAAPECRILRLTDVDGDGVYDNRTIFAEGLSLPMGVLWHEGSLFVASPPDFIRLDDADRDGISDHREVLLTGWNVFNTASLHGPFLGPDGRLYLTHGRHGYDITTREGERLQGLASRIWRCWPDGSGLERFAGGGFDNPVELAFLPSGEMIGTMTYFMDPKFGQRDALLHFAWGGAYPKPHPSIEELLRTGPDLMPVMSKFSRIAPSGLERYSGTSFGKDYEGVLFSAQFNPHRVQSHRLIREGATFRTEDRDFLTSTNPDFYPTDVLVDADGSLLVSDTGAWYVDACPVSRIAKPEVKGAIYRVRLAGATSNSDPWGNDISWETLSSDNLVGFLSDPRERVAQKAMTRLISIKSKALPSLKRSLNDDNELVRQRALSVVRRMDVPHRAEIYRDRLDDPSIDIRMSAIQALGDEYDSESIPMLIQHLKNSSPPEQRTAAAALGKIGDASAVAALLEASGSVADRFVEHAIIYALIELDNRDALYEVVKVVADQISDSPGKAKSALIALDQLNDDRITADHVLPLLTADTASELLPTGLWIAGRHPEFATEVLAYVRDVLESPVSQPSENLKQVLLAYAHLEECQKLIGELLSKEDRIAYGASQLFLLSTLTKTELPNFPDSWLKGIDACLRADVSQAEKIRWSALDLVHSRSITSLNETLKSIARNPDEDHAFRLSAMAASAPGIENFPLSDFQYVLSNIDDDAPPSLRQAASRILRVANLTEIQKLYLASDMLPGADPLVLSLILQVFQGESKLELGRALIAGLAQNEHFANFVNEGQLEQTLSQFPEQIHQAAISLRNKLERRNTDTTQRFLALEPRLGSGDVGKGRRIFFGETAACSSCHAIGDAGGDFGPDLTTIGEVRTGHDLLEAIMFPNSSFVPDFTPYQVEAENNVDVGLIARETAAGITLRIGVDEEKFISKFRIQSLTTSPISLMPEGLDSGLSDEEVIDLVTFLQTLNGNSFLEVAQH